MIFEKLYDGNSATKTKAVIYVDKAERKKTKQKRVKKKAATYEKNIAAYEWKCVIGCYIKVF